MEVKHHIYIYAKRDMAISNYEEIVTNLFATYFTIDLVEA